MRTDRMIWVLGFVEEYLRNQLRRVDELDREMSKLIQWLRHTNDHEDDEIQLEAWRVEDGWKQRLKALGAEKDKLFAEQLSIQSELELSPEKLLERVQRLRESFEASLARSTVRDEHGFYGSLGHTVAFQHPMRTRPGEFLPPADGVTWPVPRERHPLTRPMQAGVPVDLCEGSEEIIRNLPPTPQEQLRQVEAAGLDSAEIGITPSDKQQPAAYQGLWWAGKDVCWWLLGRGWKIDDAGMAKGRMFIPASAIIESCEPPDVDGPRLEQIAFGELSAKESD